MFAFKKSTGLEEFCRDFYETNLINPVLAGMDVGATLYNTAMRLVIEADQTFSKVDSEKFAAEMTILRFELFALAWMHKFAGKFALAQSVFTDRYLHEKGKDDIWNGMGHYNKFIDSATLHWLTSLGKMNLGFWYSMRNDLAAKNVEDAKKIGLNDKDENIERVNNRLCSENAWKQRMILSGLVLALCERLGINLKELNEEASFRLAATMQGFYNGAKESLDKVKIKA